MNLGHRTPRRRRSVRPEVTSLESRQVLSHVSPAALVHRRAAHVVRPGPTPAMTIAGGASSLPAGFHHPSQGQVVFRAGSQLGAARALGRHVPFQVGHRFAMHNIQARPFFNGPSAAPFHWTPRRGWLVHPDVTSLEGRQVLWRASPAALVHRRAAHVVRLGSTPANPTAFVGKIDGSANFLPDGFYNLDSSQVVFRASGQLDVAGAPGRQVPFRVDDHYYTFDQETMPFFNGPSATPFNFNMRFRDGRRLPVDGVILAEPPNRGNISFRFDGTIKSQDRLGTVGEIHASGVYNFSVNRSSGGPNTIIYASGTFQATLTGTIDPSMV